jgi:SAM-dependent methyltransferase
MASELDRTATEPYSFKMPAPNRLRRVAAAVSLRARRRIFDRFMSAVQPTERMSVLDVGISPSVALSDVNAFEKFYPWPHRLTTTSIEDASEVEVQYPGVTFVRTEGERLPFEDHQFDIVFSSAVIEHVGDRAAQERHARELLRVGHAVFVVTPNRWFAIDPHTMLPFVHWLPRRLHQSILAKVGHDYWAKTENLNLLSAGDLLRLFPRTTTVRVARQRTLGMTSNVIAYSIRASESMFRADQFGT